MVLELWGVETRGAALRCFSRDSPGMLVNK